MFKRIISILAFVPLMIVGFLLDKLSVVAAFIFKGKALFPAESNLYLALQKLKFPDFTTPTITGMTNYFKKVEIKGFAITAGNSFFVERKKLCNGLC